MTAGSADMDETVSFNVQVVPEFPATSALVIGTSMAIIIVMTKLKAGSSKLK